MRQYRLLLLSIVIIVIAACFLHAIITNKFTSISNISDGSTAQKIIAQNEDEYLSISAKGELYPAKSEYNVDIVITNNTNESIQIITPCGRYVSYKSSEKTNPNRNPCVAVHSTGIEKKESIITTTIVPSTNQKNEEIILTVTYELQNKNQRRYLNVILTPFHS